mmetsp:Transcript_10726/g.41669  ORF Transcript_10726/g.41669 Transcript_10726/m.41669 type:complete len:376 (-) Transcript_10726:2345-3472(-)
MGDARPRQPSPKAAAAPKRDPAAACESHGDMDAAASADEAGASERSKEWAADASHALPTAEEAMAAGTRWSIRLMAPLACPSMATPLPGQAEAMVVTMPPDAVCAVATHCERVTSHTRTRGALPAASMRPDHGCHPSTSPGPPTPSTASGSARKLETIEGPRHCSAALEVPGHPASQPPPSMFPSPAAEASRSLRDMVRAPCRPPAVPGMGPPGAPALMPLVAAAAAAAEAHIGLSPPTRTRADHRALRSQPDATDPAHAAPQKGSGPARSSSASVSASLPLAAPSPPAAQLCDRACIPDRTADHSPPASAGVVPARRRTHPSDEPSPSRQREPPLVPDAAVASFRNSMAVRRPCCECGRCDFDALRPPAEPDRP